MTSTYYTTYGMRKHLPLGDAIRLLGSKRAAQYFGRSHTFVKRWMRQNMPRVRRSLAARSRVGEGE